MLTCENMPEVAELAIDGHTVKIAGITQIRSARSAGGPNDFYSEGDYWWPDHKQPSGKPYIQKDGQSNPDCFNEHRRLMIRMGLQIAELTRLYEHTGKMAYAVAVEALADHWFVNSGTRMNPHLEYAQAIQGVCNGRSIGVIDSVHLAEVAVALDLLSRHRVLNNAVEVIGWFEQYLDWLLTHEFGRDERAEDNNHGTCWYLQAAAFALLTGNRKLLDEFRRDYRQSLLPDQMAFDGSFPRELKRTKPYSYSIFNLEAMTALCQLLSNEDENLFEYKTESGRCLRKGIEFLYPFMLDKNSWPYHQDIMYWEQWPNKQPCLLFCGLAFNETRYVDLWKKLPLRLDVFEAVRNLPVKTPQIWLRDSLLKKL